jgi:hypothetical protein
MAPTVALISDPSQVCILVQITLGFDIVKLIVVC